MGGEVTLLSCPLTSTHIQSHTGTHMCTHVLYTVNRKILVVVASWEMSVGLRPVKDDLEVCPEVTAECSMWYWKNWIMG